MKEGISLYFLAVVPPIEIQEEITELKYEISEKYGSSHALNSPPHITLHMPFQWRDKKFDQLQSLVNTLNENIEPFEVELKDFDFFEPRVVFVNVEDSEPLETLQKEVTSRSRRELKLDNANYRNQAFHPHVTIGFRDLKKPAFYVAKKEFETRSYSAKFEVKQISLLKHDGQHWNIISS